MSGINPRDMVVISRGIETLLECVRRTEVWWRACGDDAALRRAQRLGISIRTTRRKFFPEDADSDVQVAEALIVAEGLREAARQCKEGQAALHAGLAGGADTIERLCRSRGVRP